MHTTYLPGVSAKVPFKPTGGGVGGFVLHVRYQPWQSGTTFEKKSRRPALAPGQSR
jgi:hypothetical protein